MKKILTIFGLAALLGCLALGSCNKQNGPDSMPSTIASGKITNDYIIFHDSINGVYRWWLRSAWVGEDGSTQRECEKGSLDWRNATGVSVLALGYEAVLVEVGTEIGPLDFDRDAPHWQSDAMAHADVPFDSLADGQEFLVALRFLDGNNEHYGWARGRMHLVPSGKDRIEWLAVCYDTRRGAPIKAGATK